MRAITVTTSGLEEADTHKVEVAAGADMASLVAAAAEAKSKG